jgi:chromosome segregation ATPase
LKIYHAFLQSVEWIERAAMQAYSTNNIFNWSVLLQQPLQNVNEFTNIATFIQTVHPKMALSPFAMGHLATIFMQNKVNDTELSTMDTEESILSAHWMLLFTIEYINLYKLDENDEIINTKIKEIMEPLKAQLHKCNLDLDIETKKHNNCVTDEQYKKEQQRTRDANDKTTALQKERDTIAAELGSLKRNSKHSTRHTTPENDQIVENQVRMSNEIQQQTEEIERQRTIIQQRDEDVKKLGESVDRQHTIIQKLEHDIEIWKKQEFKWNETISTLERNNQELKAINTVLNSDPNRTRRPNSASITKPLITNEVSPNEVDMLRDRLRTQTDIIAKQTQKITELKEKLQRAISTHNDTLTLLTAQYTQQIELSDKKIIKLNDTVSELLRCEQTNKRKDEFINYLYKTLTTQTYNTNGARDIMDVVESEMTNLVNSIQELYTTTTTSKPGMQTPLLMVESN